MYGGTKPRKRQCFCHLQSFFKNGRSVSVVLGDFIGLEDERDLKNLAHPMNSMDPRSYNQS